jgi:3-hydroxyacyl-CoA dehydrogenase
VGLAEIVDKIKDYGERLGGAHWGLSPLLERLAADGGSLASHQNGS